MGVCEWVIRLRSSARKPPSYSAPTGLAIVLRPTPRAMPWAFTLRPVGAGKGDEKTGHPLLLPADTHFCCQPGETMSGCLQLGPANPLLRHRPPAKKTFGAATGVSDPRLPKDPKTKPRRRRLKKRDTMRTTRTPPALPQRGLDRWMIFWTIVHMVLFGYFCGLSARVLAVFWLDGITFCGLFRYWRLDACVVSPAGRYLPAVPAHLS